MPPLIIIKKGDKEIFRGGVCWEYMETTDKGWEKLSHPGEDFHIMDAKKKGTYIQHETRFPVYDVRNDEIACVSKQTIEDNPHLTRDFEKYGLRMIPWGIC